ncbi:MAG: hypothetical protein IJE04_01270 [Bacilli bacterium]|nr:hypothetical protein [Bacilli bacterium]
MDNNMRKKAANKYFKAVQELNEERKHKFIYILSIILFTLIIIKITIGEIVIPLNSRIFPYKDNRLYEVYLNNLNVEVEVQDIKKITIIPYFLSIGQYYSGVYQGSLGIYDDVKESDSYKLKINSYDCYSKVPSLEENKNIEYKISCNTEQDYIRKLTNDTKYTMYIKHTYKGKETYLYEGSFIEEITPFIIKKGRYLIEITGTYKNVESKIYVSFDKNN